MNTLSTRNGIGVVHATGNENVRQVLSALTNAGNLDSFSTTLGWTKASQIANMPSRLRVVAAKRMFDMLSQGQLTTQPARETLRNLLRLAPVSGLRRLSDTRNHFGIDWVAKGLDIAVAKRLEGGWAPSVLFGYPNQVRLSFEKARQLGILTVLELPHTHWSTTRRILLEEALRNPDWASTVEIPKGRSSLSDDADEELSFADLVLSPSSQVSRSILEFDSKIDPIFAPYGCPAVAEETSPLRWDGKGPLRVLFVGRVQASKGIADIAEVCRRMGSEIELSIIGAVPNVTSIPLHNFLRNVTYLGVLSRGDVLRHMRQNHVFLLPSLVEGRSLAALEAVSSGLPIVVTPGSGVEDLAQAGAGITVEANSPDQIHTALSSFLQEPSLVCSFSARSLDIARKSSWTAYHDILLCALTALIARDG